MASTRDNHRPIFTDRYSPIDIHRSKTANRTNAHNSKPNQMDKKTSSGDTKAGRRRAFQQPTATRHLTAGRRNSTCRLFASRKDFILPGFRTRNVSKRSSRGTRTYLSHHQLSLVPASAVLQTLARVVSVRCFSTTSKPLISTPPDAVTTHLPPRPRMKLHCGSTAFGVT